MLLVIRDRLGCRVVLVSQVYQDLMEAEELQVAAEVKETLVSSLYITLTRESEY